MRKLNQKWNWGVIVVLFGMSLPVVTVYAEDAQPNYAPSALEQGAYVAPMGVYVKSGGSVHESGPGFALRLGYRKSFYALEGSFIYIPLPGRPKELSGTASVLIYPFDALPNLFADLYVGGVEIHHYSAGTFSTTIFGGGIGYIYPLKIGTYQFGVRGQVDYRYGRREVELNEQQTDLSIPRSFNDVLFGIGMQLPIPMGGS